MLICAAIALRMKALLLGSSFRKSASSSSTLKATTAVLAVFRLMKIFSVRSSIHLTAAASESQGRGPTGSPGGFQPDFHARALVRPAPDFDVATEGLDDLADHGQPQAGA